VLGPMQQLYCGISIRHDAFFLC